jgi:tetratricopeptide (TPR) repeat protein
LGWPFFMKIPKKILDKAKQAFTERRFDEAEALYKRALQYDPTHFAARSNIAVIFNETNRIDELYSLAMELAKERPRDASALNKLGIALYRKGQFTQAYAKLKEALELEPNRLETYLNLSSVSGEVGDNRGGLEYALQAVSLNPASTSAHVNLGSAFMAVGRVPEAEKCFETVLLLDPNNTFAHTNLAVLATKGGNHARAILAYEKCLTLPSLSRIDEQKVRFFLGISYLRVGNFEEGWRNYDYGFIPESTNGRNPCRQFRVPQWHGQSLGEEDTLLVWREQGLGDELMFFSALKELEGTKAKVIVESDWRLCHILKRSFPDFTVRPQAYYDAPSFESPFLDFTLEASAGRVFSYYRRSAEDLSRSGAYLRVDDTAKALFDKRLGERNGALRVGICWRSGALSALRNVNYTSIYEWEEVLKLRNCQFVSLQYGDTKGELTKAVDELGVFINSWPDLDIKDDLDNLAALCANLDLVISVGTASAQLACAVGAPTIILCNSLTWTSFGTSTYPVYPNARFMLTKDHGGPVSSLLPVLADRLGSPGSRQSFAATGEFLDFLIAQEP